MLSVMKQPLGTQFERRQTLHLDDNDAALLFRPSQAIGSTMSMHWNRCHGLKRGKPGFSPAFTRRKKALMARSRRYKTPRAAPRMILPKP